MAPILVFIVFLIGIALSVPIGVSMVLGSVAPILLLDKGGSIVQVLNNTFSGANSTPISLQSSQMNEARLMRMESMHQPKVNITRIGTFRLPNHATQYAKELSQIASSLKLSLGTAMEL